jgi:hypothetical protein
MGVEHDILPPIVEVLRNGHGPIVSELGVHDHVVPPRIVLGWYPFFIPVYEVLPPLVRHQSFPGGDFFIEVLEIKDIHNYAKWDCLRVEENTKHPEVALSSLIVRDLLRLDKFLINNLLPTTYKQKHECQSS